MSDENNVPLNLPLDLSSDPSPMRPWEQRVAPGMSAGGGHGGEQMETPRILDRACQALDRDGFATVVNQQTDLAHLPMIERHRTPVTDLKKIVSSNREAWQLFIEERLYDTRQVTLEHFHLFEWFPATPGTFHTVQARQQRHMAYGAMERGRDGETYFSPVGKASMIKGGVGAVRLRPRTIAGEPTYFMTASSSGVCHEGFPVLVPRHFYGPLKARMLDEGAVPVTVSGEMRYVPEDAVGFFPVRRAVPLLYLHVDDLQILPQPRADVTSYLVNVASSFVGEFQGVQDSYVTFAAFDPAGRGSLERAVTWLEQVYVAGTHEGTIVTDFDEVRPRFTKAIFGLPTLMAGKLDRDQVRDLLAAQGFSPDTGEQFFVVYQEINTQGGAYIAGDVHVEHGDFIGRDQVVQNGGRG